MMALFLCLMTGGGKIWAEDVVVSTETIWQFTDFDTSSENVSITQVTQSNGLYYRAGASGRAITIQKGTGLTWTFADGTKLISSSTAYNCASLPANTALNPASSLSASDKLGDALTGSDDSNNRTIVFTTGVAGTVYVAFRGSSSSNPSADKYYRLYYKKSGGDAYQVVDQIDQSTVNSASNRQWTFAYTASEGGTFVIGGQTAMTIYAIKFVPYARIYTFSETSSLTTEAELQSLGNGLYYRGGATNDYNIKDVSGSGTFSNGTTWSTTKVANFPGISSLSFGDRRMANSNYSSSYRRCLAFDANVAGTCYVAFGSKSGASGNYWIYCNYYTDDALTSVDTKSSIQAFSTTDIVEVKLTMEKPGTYWIGTSSNNGYVYAIHFEPATKSTTIGSHGMSSFSCDKALDFSSVSGLKAYVASRVTDGQVVLASVDQVPAKTGLILKGTASSSYTIPVIPLAPSVGTNFMVQTVTETGVAASTEGAYNYMWAYTDSKGLGFYNVASGTTSAAGKAYLSSTMALDNKSAGARSFIFADEENGTTGIEVISHKPLTENQYYDLQGRRVVQPTKGLYVVNGKKVVVK